MANRSATAWRLQILQEWAGDLSNAQMATELGVAESVWAGARTKRELSKKLAFEIKKRWPQLNLEWLWFGNTDAMLPAVTRSLAEAEAITCAGSVR
jgi:hypothetical protein